MNYRALEDLINILVKKSGYELDENSVLEDINILNERKDYLEKKISELKSKTEKEEYLDNNKKNKDIEERKYLQEKLEEIKKQNDSDLSNKDKKLIEEQIKLLDLKIENIDYSDYDSKDIDNILLTLVNEENEETKQIIEDKRKQPTLVGLEILENYKSGKEFNDIKEQLKVLVQKSTESYELTYDEIGDSNIFELMDEYSKRKDDVFKRLEANNYVNEESKNEINKKCNYHHSRISSLKDTMEAIENRKEELETLIQESEGLYEFTLNNRKQKESDLSSYTIKFSSLSNIEVYKEEFSKYLDYLREEIAKNKYLENKYCEDILAYKEEIRNLDINHNNINSLLLEEEKCLDILNDQLDQLEENNAEKINDEILYLTYTDRLDKLSNEQQYYYVNIDVIEKEITNLWKKNNEKESDRDEIKEVNTNMYEDEEFKDIDKNEEDVQNEIVEDETESIDDLAQEQDEELEFLE